MRRVSGGTSIINRGSSQKVAELQIMVDKQKKQVLSLRSDRDQIAVYLRDVDAAQRAYDAVIAAPRRSSTWRARTTRPTRAC